MRYVVRQKVFSLGDSFTIKDTAGNDVFVVRSQIMSIGHKLRLYDLAGNELCYIEQKAFKLMPEYNIYVAGQYVANVKKKFTFFRNSFIITTDDFSRYTVEGDFFAHEFSIVKDGSMVASISKQFFSFADTYGVDIDDSQDQISNLALAIVIDMACHGHDN